MDSYQLPLNVKLRDDAIFDNFYVGDQAQLVNTLKNFVNDRDNKSEQFIYCYGHHGVGKTHLLQACCHASQAIFYLPLRNYAAFSPTIFDNLENQSIVCVDDIDAVLGDRAWEEALFHFYNRARDQQVSLLVSAQKPPQQLSCALPDLHSRLQWGLVFEIKNLTDAEKIQALQMRALLRGLRLPEEVAHYLMHHYSRNMQDLFEALEKLDHASLAAKRKLTIPFVKAMIYRNL